MRRTRLRMLPAPFLSELDEPEPHVIGGCPRESGDGGLDIDVPAGVVERYGAVLERLGVHWMPREGGGRLGAAVRVLSLGRDGPRRRCGRNVDVRDDHVDASRGPLQYD